MKIKLLVGFNGRFVIAENPNPVEDEIYLLEAINESIDQRDELKLLSGLYECDAVWQAHMCTHPECAHDTNDFKFINFKCIVQFTERVEMP